MTSMRDPIADRPDVDPPADYFNNLLVRDELDGRGKPGPARIRAERADAAGAAVHVVAGRLGVPEDRVQSRRCLSVGTPVVTTRPAAALRRAAAGSD